MEEEKEEEKKETKSTTDAQIIYADTMDSYKKYEDILTSLWGNKILHVASERNLVNEHCCWDFAVSGSELEGGYYRLRFQIPVPGEKVRRKNGKLANGQDRYTVSQKYTKYSFYLHHLAIIMKGEKMIGSINNVRFSISHLCQNSKCFNPSHLFQEPHSINVSRQQCFKEMCSHKPKCIKDAAKMKEAMEEKTKNLYKQFEGVISTSEKINNL